MWERSNTERNVVLFFVFTFWTQLYYKVVNCDSSLTFYISDICLYISLLSSSSSAVVWRHTQRHIWLLYDDIFCCCCSIYHLLLLYDDVVYIKNILIEANRKTIILPVFQMLVCLNKPHVNTFTYSFQHLPSNIFNEVVFIAIFFQIFIVMSCL